MPTRLDVDGTWGLTASLTQNPCGIDAPPSLAGEVGIEQFGSVLSGDFGQNTLAGQFAAANAFVFSIAQFCVQAECCGTAALSRAGSRARPGRSAAPRSSRWSRAASGSRATCAMRHHHPGEQRRRWRIFA